MEAELENSVEFREALHQIDTTTEPIFITGPAGSGKSTLLQIFRDRDSTGASVVVAPTGIAALNVRGTTIHRLFSFPINVTPSLIRQPSFKARNRRLFSRLRCLIIDETSMLRADMLDCIDVFLRRFGPQKEELFGGVRLVFFGDLYQLPPVVPPHLAGFFSGGTYQTPYFFSAHALTRSQLRVVNLVTIYRQSDAHFKSLLNRIRIGTFTQDDLDNINRACVGIKKQSRLSVTLTANNRQAEQINNQSLKGLTGDPLSFDAKYEGEVKGDDFPTEKCLVFKQGAQVMMLNNDPQRRWVNGTLGHIEAFESRRVTQDCIRVRMNDSRQRIMSVTPYAWDVYHFSLQDQQVMSRVVGRFIQYPIRLAWAFTIHKSQGKTFDSISIDLDKGTFASGQLYVALSRCRTLEGVSLESPIRAKHIRVDSKLRDFFDRNHSPVLNNVKEN